MGSRTFDFLAESFLLDDSLIRHEFRGIPESEIVGELKRYREFCLTVTPEVEAEILTGPNSNLRLFSGIKHVGLDLLKQTTFYVHQHILYDPLFELTHQMNPDGRESQKVFNSVLGFSQRPLNRKRLASVAAYLRGLRPMVAANYVKLVPTSYFFEPPKEVPLTHSETGFEERVPEALRQFFHERAIVESVKDVDGGKIIYPTLEIGRSIYIRFEDNDLSEGYGYILMPIESVSGEDANVELLLSKTTAPPEREEFEAWVFQSINQSAGRIYSRVLAENIFASRFNASYLSDSPLVFELLEQTVPLKDDVSINTTNALLNMELPFIENVDVETLMRVRIDEGEAFENFRVALDKQLRDLRLESDPRKLKIKTENAMHELMDVQVRQIDQKLASLKRSMLAEAGVTAAGLVGAIQSSGFTLPLSLLAAFKGYKSFSEYKTQKRENPAFFLWKILKQSKQSQ